MSVHPPERGPITPGKRDQPVRGKSPQIPPTPPNIRYIFYRSLREETSHLNPENVTPPIIPEASRDETPRTPRSDLYRSFTEVYRSIHGSAPDQERISQLLNILRNPPNTPPTHSSPPPLTPQPKRHSTEHRPPWYPSGSISSPHSGSSNHTSNRSQ